MDKPCEHKNVDRGELYQTCLDCGATRKKDRPGKPKDDWHVCPLCAKDHEQTMIPGTLKRSMPKEARLVEIKFKDTPLFRAMVEAEKKKAQPSFDWKNQDRRAFCPACISFGIDCNVEADEYELPCDRFIPIDRGAR